ncbi:MAG: flagellar motor protein PomA [Gammaproteobacteria bacterium]|nr:flagellar motor protein PomA [Gammaproteobacteria bacterium]
MNVLSVLGVGIVIAALYIALITSPGVTIKDYLQLSGIMVVFVGTFGAVLLKSSTSDFKAGMSLLPRVFANPMKPTKLIDQLVDFADIARKNGLIALESQVIKHSYLAKAVQLLVDGAKPDVIAKTLDAESDAQTKREKHGAMVWSYMGEVAPAMGMVGTLFGLVAVLRNMSSQEALVEGMALALLTTLYGAILANGFCLPMANKMKVQSEVEQLNRDIIMEGVSFIQTGGNPRLLADLLASYIPPSQVKQLAINANK